MNSNPEIPSDPDLVIAHSESSGAPSQIPEHLERAGEPPASERHPAGTAPQHQHQHQHQNQEHQENRIGEENRPQQEEGAVLIHGTYFENWPAIQKANGLKNVNFKHIHLVPKNKEAEEGHIPGLPEPADMLIYVKANAAKKDGFQFYEHRSKSGVMICAGKDGNVSLPLDYVEKITDRWGRQWKPTSGKQLSGRLKIDLHTHILPANLDITTELSEKGYISLQHVEGGKTKMMKDGKLFREIECNCYCAESRLKDMDETKVDLQVLSTVPVMFSYWSTDKKDAVRLARYLNNDLAEVVKSNPTRFVGLGTLPLQFPDAAIEELRYCMLELGFAGVQIGTHVNGWELSDPNLFPVFQEAQRLNAAIFVHPWDMMGAKDMAKYWLPWLVGMPAETCRAICHCVFSGMLEKLPDLRLCFAHGGGSFPFTIGRIDWGYHCRRDLCAFDNPEVSPAQYLRGPDRSSRFWCDSLVHDERALRYLIDVMGADRIVLGSDYPFPLGEQHPGHLIEGMPDLSEDVRCRLLALNALDFLDFFQDAYGNFIPKRHRPSLPIPPAVEEAAAHEKRVEAAEREERAGRPLAPVKNA